MPVALALLGQRPSLPLAPRPEFCSPPTGEGCGLGPVMSGSPRPALGRGARRGPTLQDASRPRLAPPQGKLWEVRGRKALL